MSLVLLSGFRDQNSSAMPFLGFTASPLRPHSARRNGGTKVGFGMHAWAQSQGQGVPLLCGNHAEAHNCCHAGNWAEPESGTAVLRHHGINCWCDTMDQMLRCGPAFGPLRHRRCAAEQAMASPIERTRAYSARLLLCGSAAEAALTAEHGCVVAGWPDLAVWEDRLTTCTPHHTRNI